MQSAQDTRGFFESFKMFPGNEETFVKFIDFFPFPIHIYRPDGTLLMTNNAFLEIFSVADKSKVEGTYNVLKDPVIEAWGIKPFVERGLKGETIQLKDVKVPRKEIADQYGDKFFSYETLFQDIYSFPIFNEQDDIAYVVSVFITSRMYQGKPEVAKAKEYIEQNWREKYDLKTVAGAVNMSPSHISALFRQDTGMTMGEYYRQIKLKHIKEKLSDQSMTIAEVFAACGEDSRGWCAKQFRESTGMTPREYRNRSI